MNLGNTISTSSLVVAVKEQASSDLGGEAVILNLKSGIYCSLNTVGATIWNLIQQPRTVSEIRDAILEKYEVDSEQCERDILELLQQIEAEGLIEVRSETAA